MPPTMLDSQLDTLEVPSPEEHVWVIGIAESPETIVDALVPRAT
jgi:gluconate kinase